MLYNMYPNRWIIVVLNNKSVLNFWSFPRLKFYPSRPHWKYILLLNMFLMFQHGWNIWVNTIYLLIFGRFNDWIGLFLTFYSISNSTNTYKFFPFNHPDIKMFKLTIMFSFKHNFNICFKSSNFNNLNFIMGKSLIHKGQEYFFMFIIRKYNILWVFFPIEFS